MTQGFDFDTFMDSVFWQQDDDEDDEYKDDESDEEEGEEEEDASAAASSSSEDEDDEADDEPHAIGEIPDDEVNDLIRMLEEDQKLEEERKRLAEAQAAAAAAAAAAATAVSTSASAASNVGQQQQDEPGWYNVLSGIITPPASDAAGLVAPSPTVTPRRDAASSATSASHQRRDSNNFPTVDELNGDTEEEREEDEDDVGTFKCRRCKMYFKTRRGLDQHNSYSIRHNPANFAHWARCNMCNKMYHPDAIRKHKCVALEAQQQAAAAAAAAAAVVLKVEPGVVGTTLASGTVGAADSNAHHDDSSATEGSSDEPKKRGAKRTRRTRSSAAAAAAMPIVEHREQPRRGRPRKKPRVEEATAAEFFSGIAGAPGGQQQPAAGSDQLVQLIHMHAAASLALQQQQGTGGDAQAQLQSIVQAISGLPLLAQHLQTGQNSTRAAEEALRTPGRPNRPTDTGTSAAGVPVAAPGAPGSSPPAESSDQSSIETTPATSRSRNSLSMLSPASSLLQQLGLLSPFTIRGQPPATASPQQSDASARSSSNSGLFSPLGPSVSQISPEQTTAVAPQPRAVQQIVVKVFFHQRKSAVPGFANAPVVYQNDSTEYACTLKKKFCIPVDTTLDVFLQSLSQNLLRQPDEAAEWSMDYQDEGEDWVSITTQQDWQVAIQMFINRLIMQYQRSGSLNPSQANISFLEAMQMRIFDCSNPSPTGEGMSYE